MGDGFLHLVEESKALNSSVFSLIRLQLLSNLAGIHPEFVTFRELKALLGVTDGALYSNLKVLEKMSYVECRQVRLEGKQLESFRIASEGLAEWQKVASWLERLAKVGGNGK